MDEKGQTGHDRIDAADAGSQFHKSCLTGGLVLVRTHRRYENGGVVRGNGNHRSKRYQTQFELCN